MDDDAVLVDVEDPVFGDAGGGIPGGFGAEVIFAGGDGDFDEEADVGGGGVIGFNGESGSIENDGVGLRFVHGIQADRDFLIHEVIPENGYQPLCKKAKHIGVHSRFPYFADEFPIDQFIALEIQQSGGGEYPAVLTRVFPPVFGRNRRRVGFHYGRHNSMPIIRTGRTWLVRPRVVRIRARCGSERSSSSCR
jgi:hypothetical protein